MPSDATHAAPPPLHSVFISYASADRACARALRDTLEEAGLDVWLDEEELGGGEAWDANIRNQIRTCTYFMPVISATTEERREGYFRREWRLAVERTLDLADDVMFLVPVVIDDTRDVGARVPEKFFTVQWLRVPQGQATPALRELAGKLAAGDATAEDPAPPVSRRTARKSRESAKAPPPFPSFPPYPEHGKAFRFIYDLVIWGGRLLHSLWFHLPRFVRVVASIVIIFNLIAWIFRDRDRSTSSQDEASRQLFAVDPKVKKALRTPTAGGKPQASEVIESLVGAAVDAAQAGRPLALVTFSGSDDEGEAYAESVFEDVQPLLETEEKQTTSISPFPLPENFSDVDAVLRGSRLKSQFVLTGHAYRPAPGEPLQFTAKLFAVKDGKLVWSETYDSSRVDPPTATRQLAAAVKPHLATASAQPTKP